MSKTKKSATQNMTEREVIGPVDSAFDQNKVIKLDDFSIQNANRKSELKPVIKHLVREVNRLKLSYLQLKYIFKSVREACEIVVPGNTGRKLYELPTQDELQRFYGSIEDPTHRLFFETLELTGLRCSELCGLEVARLDLPNNQAFIFQGKGKRDRIVIIPNRLAEKLRIYLDARKNRYVFESGRNTKFTRRRVNQICAYYKAKSGIAKKFTPHTLRHLFCTRLAEANISQEKRAILAGNSESVQKIYTHLGVAGVKDEVIAILDKIGR